MGLQPVEQRGDRAGGVGYDNLARWTNTPTSNFFAGAIDNAAVYPTALSATQIAAHDAASTGRG